MSVIVGKSFRARGALSELEIRSAVLSLSVMDVYLELRATMPAQYIRTFLLVAANEGLSVTEYAVLANTSKSVMSRHILDIGERDRHMQEGFGLVTYRPNPLELRRHEVFLTDKGRAMLYRIARIYEGAGLQMRA